MPFGQELLFCIQDLPCLVSFSDMLEGSAVDLTKKILYWFIEGQTHLAYEEVLTEFGPL